MKTTIKQFNYFVEACRKYVNHFGLHEWDLAYEHGKLDEYVTANCSTSIPQMSATIRLNTDRSKLLLKLSNKDLRFTALHEVSHLLIAKLDGIGRDRFVSETELIQANEEIVNRIVRLVRTIDKV